MWLEKTVNAGGLQVPVCDVFLVALLQGLGDVAASLGLNVNKGSTDNLALFAVGKVHDIIFMLGG
jgi:hypothetical protein